MKGRSKQSAVGPLESIVARGRESLAVGRLPRGARRGQFIVGGIVFLCVLMITVQAMVWFTQREAAWTKMNAAGSSAFYLAEAGYQRAYFNLQGNAANFATVLGGGTLSGLNNDVVYSDIKGGSYRVAVSPGPGTQSVTVVATGKDSANKELRAITAVLTRQGFGSGISGLTDGSFAVRADGISTAFFASNLGVEWGPVLSGNTITSGMKSSPYFWSSAGIDLDTNGATPPNQDANSCQWKSWDSNLPAAPSVNLAYYKAQAQASGTYYSGNQTWTSKTDLTGKTYYVDGNLTIGPLFGSIHIDGNLIVVGNLTFPLIGNAGTGSETITVPATAWQNYCNNWSYYKTNFDNTAPSSFPGLHSGYVSPSNSVTVSPVVVKGYTYVDKNLNGGLFSDNSVFVGVLQVKGTISSAFLSSFKVYFEPTYFNGIQTTNYQVTQTSWKETVPQAF